MVVYALNEVAILLELHSLELDLREGPFFIRLSSSYLLLQLLEFI